MDKIQSLSSGRSQGSWRNRHTDKKRKGLERKHWWSMARSQGTVITARREPKSVLRGGRERVILETDLSSRVGQMKR